jgi:hypothetical protein
MKIIKLTLITIFTLCLINQAYASKYDRTPTCPTVAQIQKQAALGTYLLRCSANDCTYDLNFPMNVGSWWTPEYWDFFMDFSAGTEAEGFTKSIAALNSLAYKSGPTLESEDLYTFFCHYSTSTDADLEATAILY